MYQMFTRTSSHSQKGNKVKPNYNSVDLAEVELADIDGEVGVNQYEQNGHSDQAAVDRYCVHACATF